MSEGKAAEGSCLCGEVTLTTATAGQELTACHCGMCRRWGGGPFMAVDCGRDVQISGSQAVGVFDSSEWAERGFCTRCGTHLFYRLKETHEYHVPVGLFGDSVSPEFKLQFFIDQKPANYSFKNETKEMTAAQLIALFTSK